MFVFFLRRAMVSCALLLGGAPGLLLAQGSGIYDQASQLVAERKEDQALVLIEQALAKTPEDPQWLYLKALSLLPSKPAQAQDLLQDLVGKHPELPEPHNALAVLYASKADFALAQHHLQKALAQRPQYRQAFENLGDVHLAMAWQAYRAAQQSGGTNLAPRIDWIEQQLRWSAQVQTPAAAPAPRRTGP